ncbi:MAG: DUF4249 family protein [Maribacter sp.]|uniref:DUF4249 family protein n=1 Tax=Maribacter sp. TaxID=1897614 RepID=UPI0032974B34
MKKMLSYLLLLLVLCGCEDVIDIEVPEEAPRLIINGIIRVDDLSQPFLPVEIRVSETNSFFEETPVTSLESILILTEIYNEDGTIIERTGFSSLIDLDEGSGIYVPNPNFSTEQRIATSVLQEENVRFVLILEHKGRKYAATARYAPVVPIDEVKQGTETLFDEEDKELIVSFTDNGDRDDFYVFDFDFGEFLVTEDAFYQGKSFEFSYFYNKDLQPGQVIDISILGADRGFYNYMNLLIEQTENNLGVFETPVATARGNVFDITGLDNIDVVDNVARPEAFPLGYFAIVQTYTETITIE